MKLPFPSFFLKVIRIIVILDLFGKVMVANLGVLWSCPPKEASWNPFCADGGRDSIEIFARRSHDDDITMHVQQLINSCFTMNRIVLLTLLAATANAFTARLPYTVRSVSFGSWNARDTSLNRRRWYSCDDTMPLNRETRSCYSLACACLSPASQSFITPFRTP